MPIVKVKPYMYFREVVRGGEITLNLPDGATVADMLEKISEMYPELRKRLENEDYILMRGGRWPKPGERVRDGDEFALFPPVGGGSPEVLQSPALPRPERRPEPVNG